jgi:hypothetical protein
VSPKDVLAKFLTTSEAELDKAAAQILASVIAGEVKGMIKAVRGIDNSHIHGLMSKTKWLIQALLDSAIGISKYYPYSQKEFVRIAKEKGISANLMQLIKLQYLLVDMESKFYLLTSDKSVIMLSMLGDWMIGNAKK